MPCFVSWRRSFRAMLATIWMWTHEWSLISSRATAFTFATCHQAFSCRSSLTRWPVVRDVRDVVVDAKDDDEDLGVDPDGQGTEDQQQDSTPDLVVRHRHERCD